MSMTEIVQAVGAFNAARKWGRYHTVPALVLALCSEVGELAHLVRWHAPARRVSARLRAAIADEVADIFIFLLGLCDRLQLDPEALVIEKLAANGERFPVKNSGSNLVRARE